MNSRTEREATYDLIVIGHLSYDEDNTPSGRAVVPSGTAYLVGLPASIYSKKIGLVSRVGEDYDLGLIRRLGVNINGVKAIKGGKTTRFYHTYERGDGSERRFRAELNVGAGLAPRDIPHEYLQSKFVHIGPMPSANQIEFLRYLRGNCKATLSVDTLKAYIISDRNSVREAFRLSDIVFLDRQEKELLGRVGAKHVVLKMGKDGARYTSGRASFCVAAPKARVVDKTGSGDVLAGVFLVLLAQGKSARFALEEAVRVASRSVEGFGVDFLLQSN